ncbi:hypothetical protein TNIN_191291 [Trichonephila inaurata madagascariensis]|uniref:Uncharacterized protein n=1 Tax=Trichonephila inaurata madagascariensis TaxID=2747483 RepID=A0A8X7C8N9_9ARAC|nr:hypothetical protein TNIN_191291 [Trichonephila inaurata madagascariensis]
MTKVRRNISCSVGWGKDYPNHFRSTEVNNKKKAVAPNKWRRKCRCSSGSGVKLPWSQLWETPRGDYSPMVHFVTVTADYWRNGQ